MNNNKKSNAWIIVLIVSLVIVLMMIVFGLVAVLMGFTFLTVNKIFTDRVTFIGEFDNDIAPYTERVYTDWDTYSYYFEKGPLARDDFSDNNYYIFKIEYDPCSEEDFKVNSISESNGNEIEVGFTYKAKCGVCAPQTLVYAYKLNKKYTTANVKVNVKASNKPRCPQNVAWKPMIYLYPEEDMNVSVILGNADLLKVSYPKYKDGWNVFAKKDGTLLLDDREYYGLFWEGNNHYNKMTDTGFVVKGEDTAKFLEEKLSILGLNEKEANEFIIFWLPKMESNKYNYIRFDDKEEMDKYMPLNVSPNPDTVIRVFMEYKALDKEVKVKEQELTKVERKGFTVIEWGGSEIK